MVVLNKIDLVDDAQLGEVKDWINSRMNRVRIVEAVQCDVPLEILLGVGRFDTQQLKDNTDGDGQNHDQDRRHPDHGQAFSTWSYQTDQPLSLDALGAMIKRKLPGNIYRCKGIIYAVDAPDKRAILQVVGRRADVSFGEEWGDVKPRTQIVAIGAPGSIDPKALTAQFDACILP
jgi:G3E family GTPase